jgi:hypothetical protein
MLLYRGEIVKEHGQEKWVPVFRPAVRPLKDYSAAPALARTR